MSASKAPKAVSAAQFARLMAPFEPFEKSPEIAVGLSGGADSLALTLLLDTWCRKRGGRLHAFIVDHKLRPESGREARRTQRLCRERRIAAHILTAPSAPQGSLQAAARELRYELLMHACRSRGLLHLCLAHHAGDQAETLLLRLARGSGLDGLSAIAAVQETPHLRVLRPLLGVTKSELEVSLRRAGIDWIEDPSNRDPRHKRVRIRNLSKMLEVEGISEERLSGTARQLGRARAALEESVAALLLRAVTLYPEGYAHLDVARLLAAPQEVGVRALARVLTTVGGGDYQPRLESLNRLFAELSPNEGAALPAARTLGGCRLLPRRYGVLVVRETVGIETVALGASKRRLWDGRFEIGWPAGTGRKAKLCIGPLGHAGRVAAGRRPRNAVPPQAQEALPALYLGEECVGEIAEAGARGRQVTAHSRAFVPLNPLTARGFTVV